MKIAGVLLIKDMDSYGLNEVKLPPNVYDYIGILMKNWLDTHPKLTIETKNDE